MEDFYRMDPATILCSDVFAGLGSFFNNPIDNLIHSFERPNISSETEGQIFGNNPIDNLIESFEQPNNSEMDDQIFCSDDDHEIFDLIKSRITTHPRYPSLISAYLECRKVGAPLEIASLLDEVCLENHTITGCFTEIGTDPELDQFMELYCIFLQRYKVELSKPLDEATTFLSQIERQLSTLFNDMSTATTSVNCPSDEATESSEEQSCSVEPSEIQKTATNTTTTTTAPQYGGRALKYMLMQKYSGYLSSLRKEFTKKRNKGKLPRDARMTLLDWWKSHSRWPYPTEEEKMKLVEVTGLDHKQITNWFINQRKRHWKPSEDQRFALMDGIHDTLYFEIGQSGTTINSTDHDQ